MVCHRGCDVSIPTRLTLGLSLQKETHIIVSHQEAARILDNKWSEIAKHLLPLHSRPFLLWEHRREHLARHPAGTQGERRSDNLGNTPDMLLPAHVAPDVF